MNIPNWIEDQISKEEIQSIEAHIAKIEKLSSAEVVPMIVRSSIPSYIFPFVALGVAGLVSYLLQVFIPLLELLPDSEHSLIAFTFPVLALLFYFLIVKNAFVMRLFTPKSFRTYFAMIRAEIEFHRQCMWKTRSGTGVLVMLSLDDHQMVILSDEKMHKAFGEESWAEILAHSLQKIKSKNLASGIEHCLASILPKLEASFPIEPNDVNELSDTLVIKD
ncbi:MAG: hypothetical protein CL674_10265 [Bdellovibrionaceae bacterium]|nr:hypothetical protein [Pseudobdellovibrionaceae bacterium]|tara:strand:- start:4731 stop:5390 length:660 start_codon:yes stop_codon:yes gene_type:complete